jgi:hypothetical protein
MQEIHSKRISVRKLRYALAASALALGVAVSAAPARASTVTDFVSFDISGSYGVGGAPYNGSAEATGSFFITFNPTVNSPGVISDLLYSVTDNRFSPSLAFNQPTPDVVNFEYNYGVLTLSSLASFSKTFIGSNDLTIGINIGTPAADVWYSKIGFGDTLTISGSASVTATPLPSTWTMMLAGLGGLGFFAYRATKNRRSALAPA